MKIVNDKDRNISKILFFMLKLDIFHKEQIRDL